MKFTLSWLKKHLDTDATLEQIVEAMTMAGLEVEDVIDPAAKLSDFTIAHVKSSEKHPDADKLSVCQVETVDGMKQIVCGAPNARAGIAVAYAPLGTYIPGLDFALDKKPRKIRGVESSGMMCSGKELELGDDHDGIIELDPANHPVGQAVSDAFNVNDPVIEFEVTPNRPDWLGVDNIARDLAAKGLGKWITPKADHVEGSFPCPVSIETTIPDACPTFVGRVINGVKNGPSPKWLQDQLKAIGLRPISALVDITNYITYDRARPLHFYDVAKLQGGITVRFGKDEEFAALDDKSYTATDQDVAICDESGILGLGGIVGGESTGCGDDTTDILIECAYFDPLTIRRSAKRLGVNSDAKYRFERGVDTGFLLGGMDLATQMVLDICGGEPSEIVIAGEIPAEPEAVTLDPARVEKLLGLKLSEAEINTILGKLGFERIDGSDTPWPFDVPTHRRDVTEEADLIEDIARIAGYDRLPATSLPRLKSEPRATELQNRLRHGRRALAMRGLSEAVTWSFVSRDHAKLFGGEENDAIVLTNPISSDLDCMRPSALIHLLLAGQTAADRGYPGAATFESGPVFFGDGPKEQAITLSGMRRLDPVRDYTGLSGDDALSAKADVFAALSAMGATPESLQISTDDLPGYFHPGRAAHLQMGPKLRLATFGELHPGVLKALGISGRIAAFEIWPEKLPKPRGKGGKTKSALALSELMPVHRDFAFIVDEAVSADSVLRAAKGADKAMISDVSLFDVYRGQGVEEGKKSLAIDVTLTPTDATLTDKDIDAISAKIIDKVAKIGGVLRG